MIPKALVDEHVHKRVDAGVEGDNHDADDVSDVSILLALQVVIQHVNDQHRKPSDTVYSANLKPNGHTHLKSEQGVESRNGAVARALPSPSPVF